MLNCSTATMFSSNKKCFIFVVFMVMCSISESFRLYTEKSLTAVRGGNISLPCNFSVSAYFVYWYKHDFTGASEDGASLVARDYQGITDPIPGFERFSITNDYSLIIRNITVLDETTYSCLVLNSEKERGYTDLRVVALAEPLEPIIEIIEPCTFTAQGGCIYHVNRPTTDEDTSEDVILVSKLFNVRPLPNLTWIGSNGRLHEHAIHQTQEKDGLFNISLQLQVSKSHLNHHYTCQAEGEAVNGTSTVVISFEDSTSHDSKDRVTWTVVNGIIVALALLLFGVNVLIYQRRLQCLTREQKDTKRRKKDGMFMAVERIGDKPDQGTKRSKKDGIFMTIGSNVADESDQDSERRETDVIFTTAGYSGTDEPVQYRRESNWWCSCGNCPVMHTDVESLCCRELKRCREIQTNGCIIDSNKFRVLCLVKPSLRVFLSFRSKDHRIPGNMGNESYRFAAYRIWSDYLHGYMGKGVRRPLPACVVTRVRQEFPEETGVYVGFEFGKGNVGEKESKCLLPEQ